jgi:hypothetical protein
MGGFEGADGDGDAVNDRAAFPSPIRRSYAVPFRDLGCGFQVTEHEA